MAEENKKSGLFNFRKNASEPEEAKGNEYTDLFDEKANTSINQDESQVLDSVVSTADGKSQDSDILGIKKKNYVDTSSFIDQNYHLRKKLSFVRGLFFFLVFVSVSLFGYFFIELNINFELLNDHLGRNTAQTAQDLQEKVVSTQTKINENRYRIAKIYLDEFSYVSDRYLTNYEQWQSAFANSLQKDQAESELISLHETLSNDFEKAKQKLQSKNWVAYDNNELVFDKDDPNSIETQYQTHFLVLLRDHFQDQKSAGLKTASASKDTLDEIEQTLNLVGNKELLAQLKKNDFSSLDFASAVNTIHNVNDAIANPLSHVYKIKRDRISWSKVMQEIDLITSTVDPYYNNDFFEEAGGVKYVNYQFDAESGRVIVTGRVKNTEAKNFTVLANLIDKFEQSKFFTEVSMRSFAKAGSDDDGYNSVVKLSFVLQKQFFDIGDIQALLNDTVETLTFSDTEKVPVKKPVKKVKRK